MLVQGTSLVEETGREPMAAPGGPEIPVTTGGILLVRAT